MELQDSTKAYVGVLSLDIITSPEKLNGQWNTTRLLQQYYGVRKELRSTCFYFGDATWNFFASFDRCKGNSLFGINVQEYRSSDAVLDCNCNIEFHLNTKEPKSIIFKFKCESADSYCSVEDFLSKAELDGCLRHGINIVFSLTVKKLSTQEVSRQAHSNNSTVEACTQTELLEKQNQEQVESDDDINDRDVMIRLLYGPDYDSEDEDDEDYIYNEEEEEDDEEDEESDKEDEESDNEDEDVEDNEQLQTQKDAQMPEKNASPLKCEKKDEKENDNDIEISELNAVYNMCQDLKQLLLSEEYFDVILQVGDQQFKAHRSILSSRSSVFAVMFRSDTKENTTGLVNVEGCEPFSFQVLLEFMYCCSTEKLSIENMFYLYTSADKYDVHNLKMKCLQFIKNNLSKETFCETVRLALQHPETKLLELATEFFARNMKEIIVTVKWQAFLAENPISCNELSIKALTHWQLKPENT